MFKKKVNFEEFIDLFTEAILYKLPIKVDPIDISIEEAKEISNHIPIFQLLILSDYLLSIIDFKNDANYLRNYIWYKIEGKIKDLKDKDLIVSTKIDNVYSAFIIGIGNNALYTINEKYKEDSKLLKTKIIDQGFILCKNYADYIMPVYDIQNEVMRMKNFRTFDYFKQVYKKTINEFRKFKIFRLSLTEENIIMDILDKIKENTRKKEIEQKKVEYYSRNKMQKLSEEQKHKVLQSLSEWVKCEESKGKILGLESIKSPLSNQTENNDQQKNERESNRDASSIHMSIGSSPNHNVADQLESLFTKKKNND